MTISYWQHPELWPLSHLKTAIAAREAAMKAIIMYSAIVEDFYFLISECGVDNVSDFGESLKLGFVVAVA